MITVVSSAKHKHTLIFKHIDTRMVYLPCYVFTTILNGYNCGLTAYTLLAYSYCTMHINDKATPTNGISYSCHVRAAELV